VVKKGLAALQKKASHSNIAKPHTTAKKHLKFATDISYEACLGYSKPSVVPVAPVESANQLKLPKEANLKDNASVGPVEVPKGDEAFHKMIDDMAYKVWACGRDKSQTYL
jgi:hypothetical protein